MEYLFIIGVDESVPLPQPGTPEFGEWMGAWTAFTGALMEGGHWLAGAQLQPSATATTLRAGAEKPLVIDGPFIEGKEQIAGYYLVSAEDLDQALALAALCPVGSGAIEVRPIAFRPDAPADH